MKRTLSVSFAVICALLSVTAARAYPASPPNHDTYVDVNAPDGNFNGNMLEVSASTTICEPTTFAFLQWELSHIPAYSEVPTATLTLTTFYAMNSGDARVALYATNADWTEETLTYANAPALGTKLDSQPVPPVGEALTFSGEALRLYLEEQLTGNRIASFALLLEGTCSSFTFVLFNDRESAVDVPDLHLETLTHPADLGIHKTGPAFATPGQTITYTLVYTNVGDIPVNYAVVTDTLPAEVQVYTYTDPLSPTLSGNALMWELFNLAPGDSGALTITAIVSPTFTGLLTNTATITTTAVESDTTNNTSLPVVTEVRAPDLAIHKTGPAMAYPGDVIAYTVVYTNTGNAPAPYVTITDVLPPQLTALDHTGTLVLPLPGQTLTWEMFDLAPGDGGVLTITAIVSPTFTGLLTNTAAITTTVVESDTVNNTAPPAVTEVGVPDLVIHKSGPATAYPGDVIAYTVVYTNTGVAAAPYVTITDLLPLNTQLYDHSGTVLLPMPDGALTWEVFNLTPGASGTLTIAIVISPTYTGWITNTATIATTAPEFIVDNNASAVSTQVTSRPDVWHYLYLPLVMRNSP